MPAPGLRRQRSAPSQTPPPGLGSRVRACDEFVERDRAVAGPQAARRAESGMPHSVEMPAPVKERYGAGPRHHMPSASTPCADRCDHFKTSDFSIPTIARQPDLAVITPDRQYASRALKSGPSYQAPWSRCLITGPHHAALATVPWVPSPLRSFLTLKVLNRQAAPGLIHRLRLQTDDQQSCTGFQFTPQSQTAIRMDDSIKRMGNERQEDRLARDAKKSLHASRASRHPAKNRTRAPEYYAPRSAMPGADLPPPSGLTPHSRSKKPERCRGLFFVTNGPVAMAIIRSAVIG